MSYYWQIYRMLLRNSLIRDMSFKANFLLWLVTELLWFVGQLVFVNVLFLYTEQIGTWSKWEVVLLIGTHQIIGQIFQAFFYVNIANLPELIRTGRLDLMLLLPMDEIRDVVSFRPPEQSGFLMYVSVVGAQRLELVSRLEAARQQQEAF